MFVRCFVCVRECRDLRNFWNDSSFCVNPLFNNLKKNIFLIRAQSRRKPTVHQATFPCYNFSLPNFASLISTTTPGPPRTTDSLDSQKIQTSLQNEDHSTTVWTDTRISVQIWDCRSYPTFSHKQFNWQTVEIDTTVFKPRAGKHASVVATAPRTTTTTIVVAYV